MDRRRRGRNLRAELDGADAAEAADAGAAAGEEGALADEAVEGGQGQQAAPHHQPPLAAALAQQAEPAPIAAAAPPAMIPGLAGLVELAAGQPGLAAHPADLGLPPPAAPAAVPPAQAAAPPVPAAPPPAEALQAAQAWHAAAHPHQPGEQPEQAAAPPAVAAAPPAQAGPLQQPFGFPHGAAPAAGQHWPFAMPQHPQVQQPQPQFHLGSPPRPGLPRRRDALTPVHGESPARRRLRTSQSALSPRGLASGLASLLCDPSFMNALRQHHNAQGSLPQMLTGAAATMALAQQEAAAGAGPRLQRPLPADLRLGGRMDVPDVRGAFSTAVEVALAPHRDQLGTASMRNSRAIMTATGEATYRMCSVLVGGGPLSPRDTASWLCDMQRANASNLLISRLAPALREMDVPSSTADALAAEVQTAVAASFERFISYGGTLGWSRGEHEALWIEATNDLRAPHALRHKLLGLFQHSSSAPAAATRTFLRNTLQEAAMMEQSLPASAWARHHGAQMGTMDRIVSAVVEGLPRMRATITDLETKEAFRAASGKGSAAGAARGFGSRGCEPMGGGGGYSRSYGSGADPYNYGPATASGRAPYSSRSRSSAEASGSQGFAGEVRPSSSGGFGAPPGYHAASGPHGGYGAPPAGGGGSSGGHLSGGGGPRGPAAAGPRRVDVLLETANANRQRAGKRPFPNRSALLDACRQLRVGSQELCLNYSALESCRDSHCPRAHLEVESLAERLAQQGKVEWASEGLGDGSSADAGQLPPPDLDWGEVDCELDEDALLPIAPATCAAVPAPPGYPTSLPPAVPANCLSALHQLASACNGFDSADTPLQLATEITSPQLFSQQVHAMARPPPDFRPGRLRSHLIVWRSYFKWAQGGGSLSTDQKLLLRSIEEGVRFNFQGVGDPAQLPAARRKKLSIVRQMVRSVKPTEDPDTYLSGVTPHAIQFPNHSSTSTHNRAWVTEEVQKCLTAGVIRKWPAEWGPPTVINGLRVVERTVEGRLKRRLCMNPMYPNQFMFIPPLRYERVTDMPHFLRQGDFMFTTDDKSGYWNLELHPSMYRYAAFEWAGSVFCWLVLAFGFAPACWIYSHMKREIFRPLRVRAVDLSFLIDDLDVAARTLPQSQLLCRSTVLLLTALGFTLSLDKCQLSPAHRVRFLGFIVDTLVEAFEVPEEKVEALALEVATLQAASTISYRDVARVAGRITAMSPAVASAPLHARVVGRAAAGVTSWEDAVGDAQSFLQRAQLFVQLLRTRNGKAWWPRKPALQLQAAGDASDRGYGALLLGQELGAGEASRMRVPFTQRELERMAANEFSSTERELQTIIHVLVWLHRSRRELLHGRLLQYQTDSQAAEACVLGMKGRGRCLDLVDELLTTCARLGAEVQLVWFPRTASAQREADALSKYEDASQWCLNQKVYESLWSEPCLDLVGPGPHAPVIDVFADEQTTKLPGRFFSRFWSPNTLGVDAFAQDWAQWAQGGLLFINPPFDEMGRVVRKVEDERVSCVIIVPVWPVVWVSALNRLPVRCRRRLPHRPDLFVPGKQVPGNPRPKAPRYAVEAVYVIW